MAEHAARCAGVWIVIAACVCGTASIANGQAPDAPLLMLDDAIVLAVAHNRQLENARLQVDQARHRTEAGRTRRLPKIDLQGSVGQLLTPVRFTFPAGFLGVHPLLGPLPSTDRTFDVPRRPTATVTALVLQPITQLHRIGLSVDQGALAEQRAAEQVRAAEQSLVMNVRRAYYAVMQSDTAIRSSTQAVALYREIDRLVSDYVAEQTVLPADGLEVRARLAQEEQNLSSLRNTRASHQEQLNLLLGRNLPTPFSVEPVPDILPEEIDLAAAPARALASRPDLREARLKRQQADLDVRIAKAQSIPDVSLALGYVSTFNVDFLPRHLTTGGIQVTWEPWDWGRRRRDVDERQVTAKQAATAVTELEQQVTLEVRTQFRRVQDARGLIDVAKQAEDAARERLRVATTRLKEEAALVRDVLQQQDALGAATARHQQALLGFWSARAEFLKALGEDDRR